ncbi:MAG: peptidylprolyl isomerase [Gammaproteobacteria bacterium]|nr:peptidylprolyl isomerase [Gammaproteobacteria bacterium]
MNITFKRSLAAMAMLALLAGCNSGNGSSDKASADTADAVAVVNGEGITEAQFNAYVQRRTGGDAGTLDPQMRQQIVNELVNITLLAQRAESMELHKQQPLKARLAFERNTSLADAAMSSYLEENPVTEEDVRAEYEARKDELGGSEFKARHILVDDKQTAEQLIVQLDEGADFVALAKENSTEPGADQSGGDLGWFSPNQMVAPFSNAVQSMEPGNYSSEPVETQFGWHVILLEETRSVEPPAFEEVSQRIERFLTNQRIQAYINELRGKANVDMKGESAAPAESADETAEQAE